MKRWLFAILGLALAAGALVALLSGRGPRSREDVPPHGEIDDASRAELERVLRDAEREGAAAERHP